MSDMKMKMMCGVSDFTERVEVWNLQSDMVVGANIIGTSFLDTVPKIARNIPNAA